METEPGVKSRGLVFFSLQQERQKRIGPGGLDPVEVFESLPKVLFFFV